MSYYTQKQDDAIALLKAELIKPQMADRHEAGCEEVFDPWWLFPCFYGSYSRAFDDMAIEVLENLLDPALLTNGNKETLAHEMFREVLCTSHFCDYGTSPRVCFPTSSFRELLPKLLEMWRGYRALSWEAPSQ